MSYIHWEPPTTMLKLPKKCYITNDKIGLDYTIATNIESNKIFYLHNKFEETSYPQSEDSSDFLSY